MTEATDNTQVLAELERAQERSGGDNVFTLIERMKPELQKALGDAIGAERFARIVQTEVRRNVKLQECDPHSLLGAMMLAVQLGLEPGPLGHVYLVPFKNSQTGRHEVNFIVGYKGYIDLAFRSGAVKDVRAEIVYEGDAFEYREGTRPFLDHTPSGPPAERPYTHVYAVARLRSGGTPFKVLFPEDIEKAKERSQAGRKNQGPWVTDWAAMARKTPVRRLAPFMPLSATHEGRDFARALAADEQPAPPVEETVEGGDNGHE